MSMHMRFSLRLLLYCSYIDYPALANWTPYPEARFPYGNANARQFHKIKSDPGAAKHDFPGVYILHNLDKDMYYVGQGKRVMQRVGNHFAGHGNGDVYADYKYGDRFSILDHIVEEKRMFLE